jgi:hypothetical protein
VLSSLLHERAWLGPGGLLRDCHWRAGIVLHGATCMLFPANDESGICATIYNPDAMNYS